MRKRWKETQQTSTSVADGRTLLGIGPGGKI
jgi:hypothetical protein